jgi:hypothetical protein
MITPKVKPLHQGRMGNFLFQAACGMAYAWRHGLEWTLPNETQNRIHNPLYLQHLVRPFDPRLPQILLKEMSHGYQVLPFANDFRKKNVLLKGYWQSEKYFEEYRKQILTTFGFPWTPCDGVSVHVRRGDYLSLTRKHPAVPKEWIETAMRLFPGKCFHFFSDDLPWCRAAFGQRDDVQFSLGKNETEDLVMMSGCEHHICSASTFSWWGAWLNQNPNKRVIMPKNWFVPGFGGHDTRDIIPKGWERL